MPLTYGLHTSCLLYIYHKNKKNVNKGEKFGEIVEPCIKHCHTYYMTMTKLSTEVSHSSSWCPRRQLQWPQLQRQRTASRRGLERGPGAIPATTLPLAHTSAPAPVCPHTTCNVKYTVESAYKEPAYKEHAYKELLVIMN